MFHLTAPFHLASTMASASLSAPTPVKGTPSAPNQPAAAPLPAPSGVPHAAAIALLVAALSFALYFATAARGIWWGDGPELTAAAYALGVPHPTGYPFYMLSGHAFIRLLAPWVEPIRAMTLYSSLALALAASLLALLLLRVIREAFSAPPSLNQSVAAASLAMLMAVAFTVWQHATFPEVYPLTLLLAVAIVAAAWHPAARPPGTRRLAALAFLLGLASTNHYSILALYPLAVLTALAWLRRSIHPGRAALLAGAAWIAPLALYLYLPLRARANPLLNEGNPDTLRELFIYLSARRYASFAGGDGSLLLAGLNRWLEWWGRQWLPSPPLTRPLAIAFGAVLLLAAAAGLLRLARRRPALATGLLISMIATLAFSLFYRINDIDGYFLIALPAALIGWVECAAALRPRAMRFSLAGVIPALIAIAAAGFHYPTLDLSNERVAAGYGRRILGALPADAVLIVTYESAVFPLLYEQIVHRRRPDVPVVVLDWLYSEWYSPYIIPGGEPRVPFRIPRRYSAVNEQVDNDLVNGIIRPAFRDGHRIFLVLGKYNFIDTYYPPLPWLPLLPPDYRLPPSSASLHLGFLLYELTPNEDLAAMTDAEITDLIARFHAPAPPVP